MGGDDRPGGGGVWGEALGRWEGRRWGGRRSTPPVNQLVPRRGRHGSRGGAPVASEVGSAAVAGALVLHAVPMRVALALVLVPFLGPSVRGDEANYGRPGGLARLEQAAVLDRRGPLVGAGCLRELSEILLSRSGCQAVAAHGGRPVLTHGGNQLAYSRPSSRLGECNPVPLSARPRMAGARGTPHLGRRRSCRWGVVRPLAGGDHLLSDCRFAV